MRERYGGDRRIALGATLTFEQSYDQIDGGDIDDDDEEEEPKRRWDVPRSTL